MKVLIDIPEVRYKQILDENHTIEHYLEEAVRHGKPLPKNHNIGDLTKLINAMKERNDDNGGEPLNAVDRGYDLAYQHMVKEAKECTIIEAEREEESCRKCKHSQELNGEFCYECVKGIKSNFEAEGEDSDGITK